MLEPPYESTLGKPSYEVYPNCGFEFGNDDNPGTARPDSFEQYRRRWVAEGSPRFDTALLLVVEDTFELSGRPGLTLTPHVERELDPGAYPAVATRPGGSRESITVTLSWVHFSPGGFPPRLPDPGCFEVRYSDRHAHCVGVARACESSTMCSVVAVTNKHLVLGGRLAPLGCTVAFIDRGCTEVLSEIKVVHADHELDVVGPIEFEAAVGRLDPMEAPWTTEVIADCGGWTAYLNNFVNGGDPSAIAPALARHMLATCVTAVHMPRYGPGHASTQLVLEGPSGEPPLMAIRSLAAHCEDGRWSWHEWGKVQPFERPERYRARLKRDRLDRPLLVEYLDALGIHVDHDGYFGRAWAVRQLVDWHVRRESVEDFRRLNAWT